MSEEYTKIHILIGVSSINDDTINKLSTAFKNRGIEIKEVYKKFNKLSLEKFLSETNGINLILVAEYLQQSHPYTVDDFERLMDLSNNAVIIPILSNDRKGSTYVNNLLSIGIRTGVFESDSKLAMIIDMYLNGRSRKDAKFYYGINSTVEDDNTLDIKGAVDYILKGSKEKIVNRIEYIKGKVTKDEFLIIQSYLPKDILALYMELNISEEVKPLTKVVQEEKPVQVKQKQVKPGKERIKNVKVKEDKVKEDKGESLLDKLRGAVKKADAKLSSNNEDTNSDGSADVKQEPKLKVKQEKHKVAPKEDISNEIDIENTLIVVRKEMQRIVKKVVIGFAGVQERVGTTHQTILFGNYLMAAGYNVAILECSSNNCFDKLRDALKCTQTDDSFTYKSIDYYPNFELSNIQKLYSNDYNFILIDFGLYSDIILHEYCRCVLSILISGSKPWEIPKLEEIMIKINDESILKRLTYLFMSTPVEDHSYIRKNMDVLKRVYFADHCNDMFNTDGYPAMNDILYDYLLEIKPGKEQLFTKFKKLFE